MKVTYAALYVDGDENGLHHALPMATVVVHIGRWLNACVVQFFVKREECVLGFSAFTPGTRLSRHVIYVISAQFRTETVLRDETVSTKIKVAAMSMTHV